MLSRNDLLLEGIGFCLKAPAPAGGFVIKIAGYA